MVNSFLFGNQASSQSKYLLEFKAGKMLLEGTTVNPINRKGLVYLHRADDNLMHFCWKDRTSGQLEDDLIIFPDDTEFKKVEQCTTGRVFVLKFKSTNKKCFYWMQEPKDDKDEDICKKVNEFLNNPSASASRNSSGLGHSLTDMPESDLHNLINNVSSQQLMQLLSRVNGVGSNQVLANLLNQSGSGSSRASRHSGSSRSSTKQSSSSASNNSSNSSSNNNQESSSTTTNTTNTTNTSTQSPTTVTPTTTPVVSNMPGSIQLSDLQNIISGLAVGKKDEVSVDLASVVNSDALKTLLENKEFMDKVKELIPDTSEAGLPERSLPAQVTATIESVQFKSALGTFNSALQSGLLGPLVQQFNLSDACVEAANKGNLEEFVKAMEAQSTKVKKSPAATAEEEKKDGAEDADMALE